MNTQKTTHRLGSFENPYLIDTNNRAAEDIYEDVVAILRPMRDAWVDTRLIISPDVAILCDRIPGRATEAMRNAYLGLTHAHPETPVIRGPHSFKTSLVLQRVLPGEHIEVRMDWIVFVNSKPSDTIEPSQPKE